MSERPQSVFEKQISPFIQAAVVLGLIVVAIFISKIVSASSIDVRDSFPWEMTFSGLLFYAIFNCIFSFAYEDQNVYWWKSLLSFALLGILGMLLAWWVSGLTMDEAGSYRWMALLFTFCYLVMLTMCRAMRMILKWAQQQGRQRQ